jgi:bisphosphoglycerate-independent phosphoglycerate mutase (AlkP superfamily)
VEARGRLDRQLLDVAPTVLELLGLDVPAEMRGRSMAGALAEAS